MTTENIKYLLTGEDQATSVFNKVKQAIDANDQSVGRFAKTVKTGAVVTGQLSSALGALPLGEAGRQAAQAASQFELLWRAKQMNTAGSLAFKVGLVGLVGVLGFQLGKAIGDAIFNTKKWADELEAAKKQLADIGDKMLSISQGQHRDRMGDIQLIRDPEKQREALDAYLKQINMNIEGVNGLARRTAAARKEIQEMEAAWFKSGNFKAEIDVRKQLLAEDEKRYEMLKAQRDEIHKMTGEAQQEREALKKENERLDALEKMAEAYEQEIAKIELGDREYERRKALLNAVTAEEQAHIEALVQKKFALLDEQEAIKLAKQEADERERALQKQIDTDNKFLESLESQLIALRDGKDAAEDYRAKLAGVSDETLRAGNAIRDQIRAIEQTREAEKLAEQERVEAAKKLAAFDQAAGSVSATESRLLTRGAGVSDEKQIADNTKKMVDEITKSRNLQAETLRVMLEISRTRVATLGAV